MQEITMLTPYLLTEFHGFNVYLISGTRNAILNFSRDQRGNSTKYQKGDHYSLVHTEEHTWTEDWTRTTQKVGRPCISTKWPTVKLVLEETLSTRQVWRSYVGLAESVGYSAMWRPATPPPLSTILSPLQLGN
jgi:hypothetical protein